MDNAVGPKKVVGRPFKKGQVANPKGRPRVSPEERAIRELTTREFTIMFNRARFMTDLQITTAIKNPEIPAFEKGLYQILRRVSSVYDPQCMEFLLNRSIGKVTDNIRHVSPMLTIIERPGGGQTILGAEVKEGDLKYEDQN